MVPDQGSPVLGRLEAIPIPSFLSFYSSPVMSGGVGLGSSPFSPAPNWLSRWSGKHEGYGETMTVFGGVKKSVREELKSMNARIPQVRGTSQGGWVGTGIKARALRRWGCRSPIWHDEGLVPSNRPNAKKIDW